MNREELVALVNRQAAAWQNRDSRAVSTDFAQDGVLISPSGKLVGPEAIHAEAEAFFASVKAIEIRIRRILIDGNQSAIEWTWTETSTQTGEQKVMDDAIIFMVQGDKITYWREYINKPVLSE